MTKEYLYLYLEYIAYYQRVNDTTSFVMRNEIERAMQLVLPETVVGEFNGIRIAVGNIWEDDYTQSDGTESVRPGATLFVMGSSPNTDFDVRVYEGFELDIGTQKVRVQRIDEPPGSPGSVTLEFINDSVR